MAAFPRGHPKVTTGHWPLFVVDFAGVETAEVIDCQFANCRRKQDERDEVREGHESVEDVRETPDGADCEIRPDEDDEDVERAVDVDRSLVLPADEVLKALLGVVVPAQNRREGEECEGDHQEEAGDVRAVRDEGKPLGKGLNRDVDALESKGGFPRAGDDDRETGHRADDDRVDEGAGHADQALANGFVRLGGCGGNRGGAEAGLVGEDAAGNALLQRDKERSHHAAREGLGIEGRTDDEFEGRCELGDVAKEDESADEDVENRHERNDDGRDIGDALQAADEDEAGADRHDEAGDDRRPRVGGAEDRHAGGGVCRVELRVEETERRRRDAVDLGYRADAHDAAEGAEDGEEDGEPLPVLPEALLDVVERAAEDLAILVDFAELDREKAFGVFCGHAEEGGDLHPEERAGTAGADGRRNADDIASANRGGKGSAKGAEGGDFASAVLLVVEHVA